MHVLTYILFSFIVPCALCIVFKDNEFEGRQKAFVFALLGGVCHDVKCTTFYWIQFLFISNNLNKSESPLKVLSNGGVDTLLNSITFVWFVK